MTIVEFLNARLDEEERAAREADEYSRRVNGPERPDAGMHLNMDLPALIVDERRVLREVEAKRRIIQHCEWRAQLRQTTGEATGDGLDALKDDVVLQALAEIYSDHKDYPEAVSP